MATQPYIIPNAYLSSKTSSKKRPISALTTYISNTNTATTVFNDTNILINVLQYCSGNGICNCRRVNKQFLRATYNRLLLRRPNNTPHTIHITIDSSRQMTLLYHALSRNIHCLSIVNSIEINYTLSDAQFPLLHELKRHMQIGRYKEQPMRQFAYTLVDTYDILNLVYKIKTLQQLELHCDMTPHSTDSKMSLTSRQVSLLRRSCSQLQSITCTMHRIALNELLQFEKLTDATLHLTTSLHRQRYIDNTLASKSQLQTLHVNDSEKNCSNWVKHIGTLQRLHVGVTSTAELVELQEMPLRELTYDELTE